jgi:hypothetical protein
MISRLRTERGGDARQHRRHGQYFGRNQQAEQGNRPEYGPVTDAAEPAAAVPADQHAIECGPRHPVHEFAEDQEGQNDDGTLAGRDWGR